MLLLFQASNPSPNYATTFIFSPLFNYYSVYLAYKNRGEQRARAYLISNLSHLNSIIKATIAEIGYLMSCSQAVRLISTNPSATVTQARR